MKALSSLEEREETTSRQVGNDCGSIGDSVPCFMKRLQCLDYLLCSASGQTRIYN